MDRRNTGGLGLDYEVAEVAPPKPGKDVVDAAFTAERQMMVAHNRNLIEYFARIGQSKDFNEHINLEYVQSLLKNGANINCTDKYGQTIFHEVRLLYIRGFWSLVDMCSSFESFTGLATPFCTYLVFEFVMRICIVLLQQC